MRFFPSFNTFIEIGPLSIQWYAVCILTGAAIAYFLGQYHFKKLGYSKEILSDYVFGSDTGWDSDYDSGWDLWE